MGYIFLLTYTTPLGYNIKMKIKKYTVIENHHYFKKAQKLLSKEQMRDVINILSSEPNIGEVMTGTGGVRKFRYAYCKGKGKSGGARVIYLVVIKKGVIHLLDIFGKNQKANLSNSEINEMAILVKLIKGEAK